MNDHIRISDADRDRVTARLRDHFAEGRLTADELDERIDAALGAKTFGELRRVMADLPGPVAGPAPAPPRAQQPPGAGYPAPPAPAWAARRRPRFAPVLVLVVLGALLLPGPGWAVFWPVKLFLLFWVVFLATGMLASARFRRRMRRGRPGGYPHRHQGWPGGGWQRGGWQAGPRGEA
ncbi:MAG: DUF1707 domain-containing protein [Nocardiopsaceae bacterium]|jgi:hypothetical protein|nr:DUF1707 domain-containing protein [Nocardiopsaceae bacterium]